MQVNVSLGASPEWLSLQARIVTALAPFPTARAAVLTSIEGTAIGTGPSPPLAASQHARREVPTAVDGSPTESTSRP